MKEVNQSSWSRKTHFDTFKTFEKPHFSICTKVDVSQLVNSNNSFFERFLFELKVACNAVSEFKLRISNNKVLEYDKLDINFNLLGQNNCFVSCRVKFNENYEEFRKKVQIIKSNPPEKGELYIDKSQENNVIITSYIPWISFDSVSEPSFDKDDSLIKIVYGKYSNVGERFLLPLCITAHHGLVDGYHVGLFLEKLQKSLKSID